MALQSDVGRLSLEEFARQIRGQMIPLNNRFSYFFTALPLTEEDIKEYLEEPVAALPPGLCATLPHISVLLVPYLARAIHPSSEETRNGEYVAFERPEPKHQVWTARLVKPEETIVAFAVKDEDVADHHYRFFHVISEIAADVATEALLEPFYGILREELNAGVHGEVDEESWQLKQALLRRSRRVRHRSKGFVKYARQAFIDTLTLYLHGICCDIDVETGPRQIASRHLRRRLELLESLYPPPPGYAVFPEDLSQAENAPAP
jgi:hypothetical protein